jgi:microcystin-dependent protein
VAEPFLGQVATVSFTYAPDGWATCWGQQVQASQNQALYSLLGNQFGGTAPSTFNLPNLAGRTVIGSGVAWGTQYNVGKASTNPVSLGLSNLPTHSHPTTFTNGSSQPPSSVTLTANLDLPSSPAVSGSLGGRNVGGGDPTPNNNDVLGQAGITIYASSSAGAAVPLQKLSLQGTLTGTLNTALPVTVPANTAAVSLQATGSSQALKLTAPYLVQTVIIAVQGVYPMRP